MMFVVSLIIFIVVINLFLFMKESKRECNNLNYIWTIGCLIAIIVFFLTRNYGSDPNIKDYVNFAAAVSSLILAVIAIFQNIYSSNGIQNSVTEIDEVTNQLSKTSDELNASASQILTEFSKQKEVIHELHTKVIEIAQNSEQKQSKEAPEIENGEKKDVGNHEKQIDDFIARSSLSGLLILYAVCISFQKNGLPFNVKELADKLAFVGYDYAYGYMVSTNASGLISYVSKNNMVTVKKVDEYLVKNIEKKVTERAVAFDENRKKGETPIVNFAVSDIGKIVEYFS